MVYEIYSNSASFTMELGEKIAKILPDGSTLCFAGDLGAGKTTFVRGLAKGLNITDVVQSPTFNIMKVYFKADRPLIHIDAYRLADINPDIGLDEYIGYESGITVIEWPQYIQDLIPSNAILVTIQHDGDDKRKLTIDSKDTDLSSVIK
ncbi:MAG: tRNA (adenosine(37)-N6)-threonylcarbamoyltransferase complex ATPase subunit type 1 TsaE [Bacilli bacterium]|nr:tRNA (adenosine(37)-N6)-threonylcarbamoyltransferase complex ATPase subunit type 1 TsaE [Bacilli bacterium]